MCKRGPNKPLKGHAFLVTVGGDYDDSVISSSVITRVDDSVIVPDELDVLDMKFSGDIKGNWAFGWRDLQWVEPGDINAQYKNMADLGKPIAEAIKEHGGAWAFNVMPRLDTI